MPNMTSHVITQWKNTVIGKKTEFAEVIFMPGDKHPNIYIFKILQILEESEGRLDYGLLSFISLPHREIV